MKQKVELNEYGFFSLTQKPSEQELEKYYADKYYQNGSVYQPSYSDEELQYCHNKIEQKYQCILEHGLLKEGQQHSLLDVGCGEGFTLKHFKQLNWNVKGLDYSSHGCQTINPDYSQYLTQGNIYENIGLLIANNERFDVIWLDNVLEHVLHPLELLKSLHKLSTPNGFLVIEVPNDFSIVQNYLLKNNFIDSDFWVVEPDHISYFNKQGLETICQHANWSAKSVLADFPIDWFLFNKHSNYKQNSALGKQAHQARVVLENLLHGISIEKTNRFYSAMADLGVGRQITGLFTSTQD